MAFSKWKYKYKNREFPDKGYCVDMTAKMQTQLQNIEPIKRRLTKRAIDTEIRNILKTAGNYRKGRSFSKLYIYVGRDTTQNEYISFKSENILKTADNYRKERSFSKSYTYVGRDTP